MASGRVRASERKKSPIATPDTSAMPTPGGSRPATPGSSGAASAAMTGPEFLDRLSSVPVLHQPGTVWDYGFGLDVLGLVVESLAEQSIPSLSLWCRCL